MIEGSRGMREKPYPIGWILLLILFVVSIGSIFMGRYSISWELVLHALGFWAGQNQIDVQGQIVLYQVRLVRILAAILIGAALSMAGSAYQGILRNPMVSPDILGASSGAGFGAALAITLGLHAFGVQILAFCFGLMAVYIAYLLSVLVSRKGSGMTLVLVLTGMVVGSLFTALIAIIKYVGDPYDTLPAITFWLMGGLSYVTNADIGVMLIPFLLGGVPLLLLRWRINVLSLGDEEANALGVNTRQMRVWVIVCATLLSTGAVSVGGMIGWVGLIVPHFARMLVGPDYIRLLPVTMLLGSIFLLLVDNVARCALPMELPLGVLTAFIGAPFFLGLLLQGRKGFL